ncbi:Clavaminate synthase-like protein [Gymnopus androsaceus JB14]|uniref:Clavaminate synthase-like protein n=1 Tax=Gymnopus androsaceus JB14 TaxID=1447944 RepID=A0A6A4GH92_9AGAR|nr:Clavaminate synthase-like protein [Gymnopus androsaceus JB14]
MADQNFSKIPLLDYSLTLDKLRHALINVGFLYLSNTPVDEQLVERLKNHIPNLFALPQEEKDKISKANSPHFLGYSRLGAELTKGKTDYREQFDIGTDHVSRWKPGDPDYLNVWGPSQYPDENLIPGFRQTMESYLSQVAALGTTFITLIAEALGLPPDGLSRFYDTPDRMQHRGKVVQYPVPSERSESDQGVGPHYDAGFLTILLQASPHPGLQVQNLSGDWIDAPPISGTFVVTLEFATKGIARATSHRVLSPPIGSSSPRYSVPLFHNIALDVRVRDPKYELEFPPEILKLRDERGTLSQTDSVNYSEFESQPSGMVQLMGRVRSHPDFFPDGLPKQGFAY